MLYNAVSVHKEGTTRQKANLILFCFFGFCFLNQRRVEKILSGIYTPCVSLYLGPFQVKGAGLDAAFKDNSIKMKSTLRGSEQET